MAIVLFLFQPCSAPIGEFRAQQCSVYDETPFRGELHRWVPHQDPIDPCALKCQTRDKSITTTFAPKVLDGTRCTDHSLNMCINGKCWVSSLSHGLFYIINNLFGIWCYLFMYETRLIIVALYRCVRCQPKSRYSRAFNYSPLSLTGVGSVQSRCCVYTSTDSRNFSKHHYIVCFNYPPSCHWGEVSRYGLFRSVCVH